MTEREQWEKELIDKQPVFETKADAIKHALQILEDDGDVPEIFQKTGEEKYIAANWQAFETLFRKGYERIVDMPALRKMHRQYTF